MTIIEYIFFSIYLVSLCAIFLYSLAQLILFFYYITNVSYLSAESLISFRNKLDLPFITIQLPLYNEKYVIHSLLESITKFDYPRERFEIHILDDSTDETTEIARNLVNHYTHLGFIIKLFNRKIRTGFKAGALKDATPFAKGEFIAIFDADFLPYPDFLKKTLPYFTKGSIGVVQTRWTHINQQASLLTELQAFQLNVHFTIEQSGRFMSSQFLQFNGTAGIWRKTCIEDAGGWQADTLTEDLDLSYRAQLKGWKIAYMEEVISPAELPSEIYGLKSQQFRWMKGGAETAKKLLPKLWLSNKKLLTKIMSTTHLLSSTVFVFVLFLSIASVALSFNNGFTGHLVKHYMLLLIPTSILLLCYFVANVTVAWPKETIIKRILKFVFIFPIYVSVSMAMSFHNSIAVLQGFLGKKSSFVRTPKTGSRILKGDKKSFDYFTNKITFSTFFEGILSLIFISAVILAVATGKYDFVILHILLSFGYAYIFVLSVRSSLLKN